MTKVSDYPDGWLVQDIDLTMLERDIENGMAGPHDRAWAEMWNASTLEERARLLDPPGSEEWDNL